MVQTYTITAGFLIKHLNGDITAEESLELEQKKQQSAELMALFMNLTDSKWLNKELKKMNEVDLDKGWELVQQKRAAILYQRRKENLKTVIGYLAAAATIPAVIITSLMLSPGMGKNVACIHKTHTTETYIPPAQPKAFIIMNDGTRIGIDSSTNESFEEENGTAIYVKNGVVTYDHNSNNNLYDSFSTMPGGRFTLRLPDGSKINMLPASAIRYPVSGNAARMVELTKGEASFDVVKNSNPFKVVVTTPFANAKGIIEVMGTYFNVMAYPDDKEVTTTLTRGSIKITFGDTTKELHQGQQAKFMAGGQLPVTDISNAENEIADQQQRFRFVGTSFTEVMKKIRREYEIDTVIMKVPEPSRGFTGILERTMPLDDVIAELEDNYLIKIQKNGRVLTVVPDK